MFFCNWNSNNNNRPVANNIRLNRTLVRRRWLEVFSIFFIHLYRLGFCPWPVCRLCSISSHSTHQKKQHWTPSISDLFLLFSLSCAIICLSLSFFNCNDLRVCLSFSPLAVPRYFCCCSFLFFVVTKPFSHQSSMCRNLVVSSRK